MEKWSFEGKTEDFNGKPKILRNAQRFLGKTPTC
jgi:hypothetical protein